MKKSVPIVVSFAGTDPSGGAGVQADIKAISATGAYAASVITALVAQNTQQVYSIQDVPAVFIQEQIESVFTDLHVSAVKIGMLNKKEVIDVIATALDRLLVKHVVFDPVMVAKNGSPLIEPAMIDELKTRMFPNCTLITPNIPEAEALLDRKITTEQDMIDAAVMLGETHGLNVLVKGGHFQKDEASDVLYMPSSQQYEWFHAPRVFTRNTHGTGCTFSSAIASYLAQGLPLVNAISKAKNYLTAAIQSGSEQSIGQGFGPVDHFYYLRSGADGLFSGI
jgi:hydroxymethylpyrimidine/phosphomethylpyrimidine kinase